ncbi:hypothetical protein [uncultured Oscillibacter sp.]|uniref:hypothetical protein n=1 Tax=uncultured Oscillibacter sp. TaxID=876091 RepID=UPI0025DD103D|nr:hypothetical protein [uncultured Oscillibacter sp.]
MRKSGGPMENYSFKSVAFGGFDKQDVVRYLEQASEKAAAAQRKLEEENETLRTQVAEQAEQLDQLRAQLEELTGERDALQMKLGEESAARADLEPLRLLEQDVARLTAERDALKPDAEAYAQFRERLGSIECEARKRADDLEAEAAAQTRRTVGEFRSQYQRLMSAFESTASHVNGELRKIEVTLSQLPRALDQTGAELNELSSRLEKKKEEKS